MGQLTKRYNLDTSVKTKPVQGVDDLLLALCYHWSKDTSVFPNERQRLQLPTIQLFAAYTGCRPAELVEPTRNTKRNKNLDWQDPHPWDNPDDSDYREDDESQSEPRRSKAICYEDIRLVLLKSNGVRPELAMELTLSYHKGYERKPKP
jgi:hypothetical protein